MDLKSIISNLFGRASKDEGQKIEEQAVHKRSDNPEWVARTHPDVVAAAEGGASPYEIGQIARAQRKHEDESKDEPGL